MGNIMRNWICSNVYNIRISMHRRVLSTLAIGLLFMQIASKHCFQAEPGQMKVERECQMANRNQQNKKNMNALLIEPNISPIAPSEEFKDEMCIYPILYLSAALIELGIVIYLNARARKQILTKSKDHTQLLNSSSQLIEFERIHKQNSDESCSICLGTFDLCDLIVKTNCQHVFHKECLWSWWRMHLNCPICRYSFAGHHQ